MNNRNYIFIFFLILSIVFRIIPDIANLSTWIIGITALLGAEELILSLFVSWVFLSLNDSIFQNLTEWGVIGRYFNIFLGIIYILLKNNSYKHYIYIILIYFIFGIHAYFFSSNLIISLSKSYLLITVIFILTISWVSLPTNKILLTYNKIFLFLVLIAFLSLLTLNSEYGRFVNGSGFQGILNHPQVFGSVMAILCSVCLIKIFNNKKFISIEWITFPIAFNFLIQSRSRTAIFSLIISSFLSIIIALFYDFKSKGSFKYIKYIIATFFIALIIAYSHNHHYLSGLKATVVNNPVIENSAADSRSAEDGNFVKSPAIKDAESVNSFKAIILKDSHTNNIMEVYSISRGGLISNLLESIKENVLFGVGVGIGDIGQNQIKYIPSTNVVISYPLEKGVLPLAILHELGAFGLIIFFAGLCFILRTYFISYNINFLLFSTILLCNLGESTLLSTGGVGLLQIIFLTYLIVCSSKNCHNEIRVLKR